MVNKGQLINNSANQTCDSPTNHNRLATLLSNPKALASAKVQHSHLTKPKEDEWRIV